MLKKLLIGIAIAAGLLSGGVSNASPIVWDWSPLTTGATWRGDWVNKTNGQHWGELVSFPTDTYIDGIAIYAEPGGLSSSTISIWEDVSGIPGSLLARDVGVNINGDYDGATPGLIRKYSDFFFLLLFILFFRTNPRPNRPTRLRPNSATVVGSGTLLTPYRRKAISPTPDGKPAKVPPRLPSNLAIVLSPPGVPRIPASLVSLLCGGAVPIQ